jgi:hypothetical protein
LQPTDKRVRWVLRALAVATVGICICALITRLLPHLWPTTPDLGGNRLGFPLTYWNALGLMAAYGIVLCLGLSCDPAEAAATSVLAAAATPVLATTLYFTFSRGGLAAVLVEWVS